MSVITDTKTVMQILAGKSLNNAQMLSIATKFAKHHNLQNPWDETDAEYAEVLTPWASAEGICPRSK